MTEAPISVEFDPRTLRSAGVPYMPPGNLTTAPELARAEVPHHIPFSFHGRFAASVGGAEGGGGGGGPTPSGSRA